MKQFCVADLVIGGLLAGALSLSTQTQSISQGSVPSSAARGTSLTAQVVVEKYCIGDGELNSLQLQMRYIFDNVSPERIVIYGGSPIVKRVIVAKNDAELRAGRLETEIFPSTVEAGDGRAEVLPEFFIALEPKHRHEFDSRSVIALPVQVGDLALSGILGPGDHIMRVTLQTWPEDNENVSASWAFKLKDRGTLLTEPVVTKPLPLIIKSKPTLVECR